MKEKMKKLLKVFAVCVMAFVSCFTVFACKETPPTDPETEQGPSSGQNPSGGGTTVVDYTVTETEWASATNVVASGNATMTMSQVISSGSSVQPSNCIMKFDGTTYYLEESGGKAYITKVTEGSETKYYEYNFDNDAWEKTERNASYFAQSAGYMSFPSRFAYSENFQYNSETHEYEATNHTVMGQVFVKVILGFENKKCVKLYYEIDGMGSATFTFVYGTTETITLPEVTPAPVTPSTPSGSEGEQNPSESNPSEGEGTKYTVTEAEWTSAIASEKFQNFAMRQVATNGEESYNQISEFNGTSAHEVSTDYEEYYTKEGDKCYKYEKEGTNWTKTEINESIYEVHVTSNASSFTMFTYDASYAYNSETHAYEAENITISGVSFVKVALYFEDGVLVKLSYEMTLSESGTTYTIVSTMTLTYGNVVITLPTVTE